MSDETTRFDFGSVQELMACANDPLLQASEQPIYAETDGDGLLMMGEDGDRQTVEKVDSHKLIHNETTGTVYHAATADYEIINPPEFIGPLIEELKDRDHENVSGDMWVRNGGAQVYAQLLFDDKHAIHLPGRSGRDPVKVGFNIRWSHDGGISVKADGFAQDTACTNSIRQVTSPIHVKHSGDVDDRIDWEDKWSDVLDHMGAFSESLAALIEDATEINAFDLRDGGDRNLPLYWSDDFESHDTWSARSNAPGPVKGRDVNLLAAFYYHLGFPTYMAQTAADRLMTRAARKDDPRVLSAWDVHSAATYAITHEFRGTTGASDDQYHRIASDLLLNPAKAWNDADRAAKDMGGSGPADGMLAAADNVEDDDTRSRLLQYSERSDALEQSFGD
jgi:hypothetical protein